MKHVGHRTIRIGTLKLPGDMRMRQTMARVQKLATSFGELGQLQAPVVRYAPHTDDHLKLLAGRDRIAAHMVREDTEVDVLMVECTEQEARQVELTENAVRRHDYEEQRLALLELEKLMGVAEEEIIAETGHSPTRRQVRERVAEVKGVQPETIQKQESRLRAATSIKVAPGSFETWGLELDDDWKQKIQTITVAMETLATKLTSAFAASKLLSERSMVPTHVGQDVRQQLQQLSSLIRANIPVALCPYCKGQDGILEECICCSATGWVGRDKLSGVPAEFCDRDHLLVSHRGKMKDLETGATVGNASVRDEPVKDPSGDTENDPFEEMFG